MSKFQIEQLKRLPQRPDETWQGALVRMPSWVVGDGGTPYRPWAAVWIAVKDDRVGPPNMCRSEEVSFATALDALVRFATDKEVGGYRPGRVEVRDAALAEHLAGCLAEADIEVIQTDKLPALDAMMEGMATHMLGRPVSPSVLAGKGVTIDRVRGFAEAAAALYKAAPWRHLSDEDLLKVEAPKPPAALRWFTVVGMAGETFGLTFYAKADDCWAIRRAASADEWWASRNEGFWMLSFDGITVIPTGDADVWEDEKLPVAGDEAYPWLACFEPAGGTHRADAKTLAYVEGLMRALAAISEEMIDSGRWSVTVQTPDGPIEYTLALPDLLEPPTFKTWLDRGFKPDRRSMEEMQAQMDRAIEAAKPSSEKEMNALIQREFMGKPFDPSKYPPRNPLEQAQDLCYRAFDTHGRRQVQLARQALDVCPDCADAYVLLAESTADPTEAAALYARGVEAGRRALGEDRFEKGAGHFWGVTDTRPYMRARYGLAQCLEGLGREDEALEHYRELLRLNPGDNQGVRYLFLPLLLKLGKDAEAARFMKQSKDEPTANWTYTRALLAYRLGGDTDATRKELATAVTTNPHVVGCLLTDQPMESPDTYSPGSPEEAVVCAEELRPAFVVTPGALQWLEARGRSKPTSGRRGYKQRKRRSR